ncbi:MAG: hypothetical protein ACOCZE_04785 [Planctomycetota bacterium]
MRYSTLVLLLAAIALQVGCQRQEKPLVIGPDAIEHVILYDTKIEGMGGRNVFIRADRSAWVQEVRPSRSGFQEARYPFELTEEQYRDLAEALADPSLAKMARRRHPAVPDGSLIVIGLSLDSGEHVSIVRSRKTESLPPFDRLYGLIIQAQKDVNRLKAEHQGQLDWRWRPEGFELPESQPEPVYE